ncbi:MAG: PKD domain-containing protein [Candidatus Aminicenantes bacterium]|nr:PKD domain-containing protein [Candidatus Aminicenantes bacterium]
MVAWTEGHFNACGTILYRTYTENYGWSNTKVAAEKLYSAAFPQLDIDSSGDIHMAYMDGNASANREIYYKKYSNGTWGARESVGYSPGLNSSWPRIDVDGSRVYIAWCHNYTPPGAKINKLDIVLMEKIIGANWPTGWQNVSNLPNSVSVHPFFRAQNGHIAAAWMDDNHAEGNWNIYFNERVSGIWKTSVSLDPGPNQYIPALDFDNEGNIHLIYTGKGGPTYYKKKTPYGWSSTQEISTGRTTVTTMIFLKHYKGSLHGVWRQREGTGNYIFYARGNTNGQWETPFKVSNGGEAEYTCLDVDSQGRAHVVYSDIGVGGNRDVFYVRVDQVTSYPVASFQANPQQGNPPLTVTFDASESYDPDGNIIKYEWDFGDNTIGKDIKTSHIYTTKGIYTAILTVTDDEYQKSSASTEITVGNPPVAIFTADPTAGSSPLKVSFDASGSYDPDGTITSYDWDFGDGTSGKGRIIDHTFTKTADRTVTLTVKDNEGLTDWTSTQIRITTEPVARFSASPKKGEPPLKVKFDASNSKPSEKAGSIVKYEWDFGDGSGAAFGKIMNHTYTKTGVHLVTLQITDNKGFKASAHTEIYIYVKPTAQFSASPIRGKAPLKVSFDASSSSDQDGKIKSYHWIFGDGGSGTGMKTNHTFTKSGTFKVRLTVMDNDDFDDFTLREITVFEEPTAIFNRTPGIGLVPLDVDFDASKSFDRDGKIVSYSWDFGDGTKGEGKKTKHTYEKPGKYNAILTITDDNGLKNSLNKDIEVRTKPKAAFTFSPEQGVVPLLVKLDGSGSSDEDGHIVKYLWRFGEGNSAEGKRVTHTYTVGGNIIITLQVTDNHGYTNWIQKEITLFEKPFPPINLTVQRVKNEGMFVSDYMNIVHWEKNPKNNEKFTLIKYKIFRKNYNDMNSSFILIKEVDANTFEFIDKELNSEEEMNSYIYAVSVVDDQGRESDLRTNIQVEEEG